MKDPIYHACQLADYGIYGAGGDETPEQQDFGADCLEAAIYLFRMTKEPKLRVCDKFMTEAELLEKVKEMRQKAQELRK